MSDNVKLLLVDDDQELCDLMGQYLQSEGFEVSFAHSVEQALPLLQHDGQYDLLIFDIMMPGQTGLELLQQVRPRVRTPVIMLTGRGDDIDRIIGLEMGADDYLAKPCNPRELVARIRAVLRRSVPLSGVEDHSTILNLHNIELDAGKRRVTVAGNPIELTSAEFNVLAELMRAVGSIVSKDELTEKVLHRKLTAYDRAIDVHVSRVRQKLAAAMPSSELIKTVRGAGYMLVNE
ncbi:response regulator transcription factor [Amphritea sp. 1_MG-2023]|uniref:response regulator transcription factor n=1 Tax=Amphritea sp. 1_MG-2023 TaxID=3062670 RepID=UPI0026E2DC4F|nr:response regulator transcription factor [Amphritea sp. 1_MG-2023]MDO6564812.1 response regulator transcription factor [Amphritea sp. 1_MG-2023]